MSKQTSPQNSQSQPEPLQNQQLPSEETPGQAKKKELEALSDKELDERYTATFGYTGPVIPRDQVIRAIMDNTPAPPAPQLEEAPAVKKAEAKTKKVKARNGIEYDIPTDAKGAVVVSQWNINTDNGGMYEVPNTRTIQTYKPEVFERLEDSNFFAESKLNYEVLQGA